MKKAATLIVLVLAASLAGLSAAAPQAVLQTLKGKVEVRVPGTKVWVAATEGETLSPATTLSTGFDSSVIVVMGNSTIQVKPLTRMTLDKLIEESGTVKTTTFLRVGSVAVSVKSADGLKSDFKVQSPYSTASVRGTRFEYDGLHLKVTEGVVAFIPGRPKRESQPAAPGQEPGPAAPGPAAPGAPAPTVGNAPPAPPTDDFVGAPNIPANPENVVPVPAGQSLQLQIGFQGAPPKTQGSEDPSALQQKAAPPPQAPPPPAPPKVKPQTVAPPAATTTTTTTTIPTPPTTGGVTVTIVFPS